ncbi:hypothetical protein EJ08DRAFT_138799 [Tothia fuscella]|uniref:Uncharacterized protein n=1 Tax=Tothia fuscella TaxID=1048955 RepID=A0A9P4TZ82_9PEZI|nr:hypothetical protein EJ08DRAFT_138799 [Tothia fuscella]
MGEKKYQASLISSMMQKTSLNASPLPSSPSSQQPYILQNDDDALAAIRNIHPAKFILLLAPAVKSNTNMDPFEPLGRGIEKHHSRIRHVPYVSSSGLTKTHQHFLATPDTAAVVVVVVGSGNVDEQESFARKAWEGTHDSLPMVLVSISKGEGGSTYGFKTVVRCASYRPDDLREAADLIFGS